MSNKKLRRKKPKIRNYGNGLSTYFFEEENGTMTSKVMRNGVPLIEMTAVPIKQ